MAKSDKTTPAAKTEEVSAPAPRLVRLYNKSRRQFTHKHEGVDYVSAPSSFASVHEEVAALWLKAFPDDFIGNEDAEKNLDAGTAEKAKLEADLAAAKAELEELKKQIAAK